MMKQNKKKYEKPNMDVVLLKTNAQLLQSSDLPIPIEPEPNPYQW